MGVLRAKNLLPDPKGTLIEGLCFLVVPLDIKQHGQVVQACGGTGVFAAKNLLRRKKRTAIVLVSVMLSAALLISTLSIGNGIISTVEDRLASTNVDIIISSDGMHSISRGHERVEDLGNMEGVEFASPLLVGIDRPVRMRSPNMPGTPFTPLPIGIIPETIMNVLPETNIDNMEGQFSVGGDPHYAGGTYTGPWTNEVGIDSGLATALGVQVNDTVEIEVDGQWVEFTVALNITINFGGDAGTGFFLAFFHLSELQTMLGYDLEAGGEIRDAVDTISVVTTPEYKGDREKFLGLQEDIQMLYPHYDVGSKDELVGELEAQVAMAEAFALAIGGIAFVIGALFVTATW